MQLKGIVILKLMILTTLSSSLFAQDEKVKPLLFDGAFHVGYVNQGGFINFAGPGLSVSKGSSKFVFGLLPTLRFKADKATPKNSFVFPTLGFGLTYTRKYLSLQLPLYHIPKTATRNGTWQLGFGVGYKISGLNKKRQ